MIVLVVVVVFGGGKEDAAVSADHVDGNDDINVLKNH